MSSHTEHLRSKPWISTRPSPLCTNPCFHSRRRLALLSKSDSSFAAENFVRSGIHFIALDFAQLPSVSLAEMVTQVRRAIAWIFQNAREFDGDPSQLHISGHSSGGHFAACIAVTDWVSQFGLPRQIVRSVICASGIYDLAPRPVERAERLCQARCANGRRIEPYPSPRSAVNFGYLSAAAHSRVTSSSGRATNSQRRSVRHWRHHMPNCRGSITLKLRKRLPIRIVDWASPR